MPRDGMASIVRLLRASKIATGTLLMRPIRDSVIKEPRQVRYLGISCGNV